MAMNFTDLKKSMSLQELNRMCIEIATEYAETNLFHAETYFMEKYNITRSCYNKAKEYAVTHYLVSDSIVNRMQEKAIENQARSSYSRGNSSKSHYNRLRQERKKYCISLIKKFETYIFSPSEFMKEHEIPCQDTFYVIVREALTTEREFPFESVRQIQSRFILDCKSKADIVNTSRLFELIWKQRSS